MEPLPCPFCGASPTVFEPKEGSSRVLCVSSSCGVRPRAIANTREAAITAWNTRNGVPAQGGEQEVNRG
jgi:Lar family restriction alleviation protein